MNPLVIGLIVFLAVFTQTLTGFALGLVAMPLLAATIGLHTASPMMSIVGVTVQMTILLRYRRHFRLRAVRRLPIGALVGVPFGVYMLEVASEGVVKLVLGVVVVSYALYAWFSPRLPEFKNPRWAYAFGFVSGILSGAYNTGGPPLVIYGTSQRWLPSEFKSNLQSVFLFNTSLVLINHALHGNYAQAAVWQGVLIAIPAIALGLTVGFVADQWVNPALFQKMVLVLLLVIGAQLIVGS
jgi:uncharacterized protein